MEQGLDENRPDRGTEPALKGISALTLATHDMARAVQFYRSLGFTLRYGGETAPFSSFSAGTSFLNLIAQPAERRWSWWGRVIFHVTDVDVLYARAWLSVCGPRTLPATRPGESVSST